MFLRMRSQRLSTTLKMVMGSAHFLRYGSDLDLSLTKKCQKLLLNPRGRGGGARFADVRSILLSALLKSGKQLRGNMWKMYAC